MRIQLPENFNWPFSAASFLDFWNRWHITLSKWLKNYVYTPLLVALMRRIPSPSMEPLLGVVCFFVTFFSDWCLAWADLGIYRVRYSAGRWRRDE